MEKCICPDKEGYFTYGVDTFVGAIYVTGLAGIGEAYIPITLEIDTINGTPILRKENIKIVDIGKYKFTCLDAIKEARKL